LLRGIGSAEGTKKGGIEKGLADGTAGFGRLVYGLEHFE